MSGGDPAGSAWAHGLDVLAGQGIARVAGIDGVASGLGDGLAGVALAADLEDGVDETALGAKLHAEIKTNPMSPDARRLMAAQR